MIQIRDLDSGDVFAMPTVNFENQIRRAPRATVTVQGRVQRPPAHRTPGPISTGVVAKPCPFFDQPVRSMESFRQQVQPPMPVKPYPFVQWRIAAVLIALGGLVGVLYGIAALTGSL